MTEYVVLAIVPDEVRWKETGLYKGRTPRKAIEAMLAAYPDEDTSGGGHFVAIASRYWKPETVKVETKTELKFS